MTPDEFAAALDAATACDVALRLAAGGLAVFPCGEDKAPRTPHGFKDATTDAAVIRRWFSDSSVRVGCVPGSAGLAVLDLDCVAEGGLALAEAQVEQHTGVERISHPHRVRTPSGGCHLWFTIGDKPGPLVANSRWPAVDVRGAGGYVIVWAPDKAYSLDGWDMFSGADWCLWPVDEADNQARGFVSPLDDKALDAVVARTADVQSAPSAVAFIMAPLDGVSAGRRHAAGLQAVGRLFGSTGVNVADVLPRLRSLWMSLPGPDAGRADEWAAIVKWVAAQETAAASGPDPAAAVVWDATPEGVKRAVAALGFGVRYNARRQRVEVGIPKPLRVAGQCEWEPVSEHVEALLVHTVAARCVTTGRHPKPPITAMRRWREWLAWCLVGQAPVDPFANWLHALPAWDRRPRCDYWLNVFQPADDTEPEVLQFVSRLIPMAVVKRALEPGCGADIMPVLVGPQGIGKSRCLKALMPVADWFSDSLSLHDELKVWVEKSLGPVLIEVAEMAGASRQETAKLKSILSATKDEVRLAYRRDAGEYPRRFFPVGTANDRRTLPNDPTGNRRFAVVNFVGNTKTHPDANAVVESVKASREQLFAEALVRVRNGEGLFPDPLTAGLLAAAAEGARVDDTEVEAVVNAFVEGRTARLHVGGLIREAEAWTKPDSGEQLPSRGLDSRVIRALEHAGWVRDARKSRGRMTGDKQSAVRYWWHPPGGATSPDPGSVLNRAGLPDF